MFKAIDIFNDLTSESKLVFDFIQKNGPLTKSELIINTHMKLTTLNRFMKVLENLDLIQKVSIGKSSGGRKPKLYDVNTKKYYSIGVEISRIYSQVIIVNMKMEIVFKERFLMNKEFSPGITVDTIINLILKGLREKFININMVLGIGIGAVGPIDREKGTMENPVNFNSLEWNRDVSLVSLINEKLPLKVYIDNGSNMAVLGEYLYGSGKNHKSIAYFSSGIGIRTGSMASGFINRTLNNAEDSFSKMIINVDRELESCGECGSIESYCSIPSITKAFISQIKKGKYSSINKSIEDIRFEDLLKAIEEGDTLAISTIKDSANIFGIGLSNYINLLNPELVILSGPLIKDSDIFFNTSKEIAFSKNTLLQKKQIMFEKDGRFGEDSISIGAASLVIEKLLNKL